MTDEPTKRRKRKAARAMNVLHRYEADGSYCMTVFLPGDRVVRFDDHGARIGVRTVAAVVPNLQKVVLDDGSEWTTGGTPWPPPAIPFRWGGESPDDYIWPIQEGDPEWDPEVDEYEGEDDG